MPRQKTSWTTGSRGNSKILQGEVVTTAAFLCILYLAPLSLGLKITKHKAAFNNLSLNGNSEGVKCIVDFKSPRRYDEPSASALHRWSNSIYNPTIKNVVVERVTL